MVYVCSVLETRCYKSRGTGYRGVVDTTESGARCLPWNSDLLYDELHLGTVNASALKGLGEHAFCRCVCVLSHPAKYLLQQKQKNPEIMNDLYLYLYYIQCAPVQVWLQCSFPSPLCKWVKDLSTLSYSGQDKALYKYRAFIIAR